MARAKRYYIPGQIWHITHRCHKRDFLLKLNKDRQRFLHWLFEAKRRYRLTILNYTVTSNHIHLLVQDGEDRDTIPQSIKLVAGRVGQEYNIRKNHKGAFWEDRYHATAVESGQHLLRCIVYMDLNMVRAGVVAHPSEWQFCGYNEIRKPRRKNILIDYKKLAELTGYEDYDSFLNYHRELVDDSLLNGKNSRQAHWTESVAVGGKGFLERVKAKLGFRSNGRMIIEKEGELQLREASGSYNHLFEAKKEDIKASNACFWNIKSIISES